MTHMKKWKWLNYDSVLIVEQRPMEKPVDVHTGTLTVEEFKPPKTLKKHFSKLLR